MSKELTLPTSDDAMKGAQLTTQYHRATGGMKEVVIFGAMMIQLREEHPETAKHGGNRRSSSTVELEKVTLRGWLEKNAPEVKLTTALRFLHVTEAIAQDYVEIVGAKIAKLMPMSQLVTTALEELPETAQAKQLELFEWINGTSQKSWLDRFNPESPQKRGHKTKIDQGNNTPKPMTAADLAAAAEEEIISILNALDGWFLAAHHTRVKKDTLTTTDAVLEEARKKLKAVKS
jgi:hypothetical protein